MTTRIENLLFNESDTKYRDFISKLTPSVSKERYIGVRVPIIREIAKQLDKNEIEQFIVSLPHFYYEENLLHGFLIQKEKDYKKALEEIQHFLPYVDNWAVCDTMMPKVFKKHSAELLPEVKKWIQSKEIYTIRFGVDCLMNIYLDDLFKEEYLLYPLDINNDDYYVKMMVAWYYATALAKQYKSTIKIFENNLIKDKWTHNKAIQKAQESYRVNEDAKAYLKTLKR